MVHYVKIGNSVCKMETITEFDISKKEELEIIGEMEIKGWKHYKTIEHVYGRCIQSNVIFWQEVDKKAP